MPGKTFSRSICWLRRDLRLSDHAALAAATAVSQEVVVVFIYDSTILDELADRADRRVSFIHRSVDDLQAQLAESGSVIVARHGDPVDLIPMLAQSLVAQAVFCAHDDDPYAKARDKTVADKLAAAGIAFQSVKDVTVFERQDILSGAGEPFRVYTPYKKAWRLAVRPEDIAPRDVDLSRLVPARRLIGHSIGNLSLERIGFQPSDLWLEPGETGAQRQLADFLARIDRYGDERDFPALGTTSGLSVHLRFGTISVRECVRDAIERPTPGAQKWLDEVIWRDFYHMILANFPHVVDRCFRPEYDAIDWPGSDVEFQAWCQGRTGYPLVDAAMRCLNATGWMHNRLRMVTAMFLTKDLLVDWRRGEQYFAEKLLDFELASNSGGWQWSAGVGVDAQPYFRIFNPVLQSRKFDAEGAFIRQWCPELAHLDDDLIHWPHPEPGALAFDRLDYPAPIVEHHEQKAKVISLFERAREASLPQAKLSAGVGGG